MVTLYHSGFLGKNPPCLPKEKNRKLKGEYNKMQRVYKQCSKPKCYKKSTNRSYSPTKKVIKKKRATTRLTKVKTGPTYSKRTPSRYKFLYDRKKDKEEISKEDMDFITKHTRSTNMFNITKVN